jgi:D-lactate dehydrogenase (cytochrome)
VTADEAGYLRDESRRTGRAERIVFAADEDDVGRALDEARDNGWPVTVQGARTGITAGAVPEGGLILNLSRMKRIGAVADRRVTVQPGALLSEINAAVAPQGLFFPPDPTETSASIGGMIACNASGALSYHYGPTRRWIRSARVMLADGETLTLRRGEQRAQGRRFALTTGSGRVITGDLPALKMPAVKNAAGYYVKPDMDLLDLFIGMEGTLGIITEAELDLLPLPPVRQALTAFFPAEAGALAFVRFLRGGNGPLPLTPVAIEFFDADALNLLRQAQKETPAFSHLPTLPASCAAAIYVELHGADAAALEPAVLAIAARLQSFGASDDTCWFADQPPVLDRLKTFRHATPEAVNLLIDERRKTCPNLTKLGTDMAVPDAALESILARYHGDLAAAGLESVIFGHIGDNHVHVNILPRTLAEYDRGKALYREWAGIVTALGGSVSAEHGIGKIKVALLEVQYGADGIDGMKKLKRLFDPGARLNRGNLFTP